MDYLMLGVWPAILKTCPDSSLKQTCDVKFLENIHK